MKKYLKEILPAFILALVASFMLFVYEPIIMYASNVNDFWFDFYVLMSSTLIAFGITFISIFLVYNLIYLFTKLVLKKSEKIYKYTLLIGFALFIITYIQGNFLAGKLPVLDGTPIDWGKYTTQSIVSIVLLIITFAIVAFLTFKFKIDKTVKYCTFVAIAIFVMLLISLVSTCLTKSECLKRKEYMVTATTRNINKYSKNKNFVIFMLDAIDSETAEQVYNENEEFKNVLKDFTYFPDTVSGYAFTRDNVPLVLSGVWSENKTDFATFYNDAMDNSQLLELLDKEKYEANIYEDEFGYYREGSRKIKNLDYDNKVDKVKFVKQEIRYDLFKYLPFYLKKEAKIEYLNFKDTRKQNENVENAFVWTDKNFCNEYLSQEVKISNDCQFKFIHLEGAHHPFNLDKNLNDIEGGTYEEKIAASFTTIQKYIDYLKKNNIYDNTAIIIMADHGFWWETDAESLLKRQNPIFYVKGFNETHDERQVSDEKMSFDYLQEMYRALLAGKNAKDTLENVDTSKPRRFLLYMISGYDHMVEYKQYGHSKDMETLKETGNVYDR